MCRSLHMMYDVRTVMYICTYIHTHKKRWELLVDGGSHLLSHPIRIIKSRFPCSLQLFLTLIIFHKWKGREGGNGMGRNS